MGTSTAQSFEPCMDTKYYLGSPPSPNTQHIYTDRYKWNMTHETCIAWTCHMTCLTGEDLYAAAKKHLRLCQMAGVEMKPKHHLFAHLIFKSCPDSVEGIYLGKLCNRCKNMILRTRIETQGRFQTHCKQIMCFIYLLKPVSSVFFSMLCFCNVDQYFKHIFNM